MSGRSRHGNRTLKHTRERYFGKVIKPNSGTKTGPTFVLTWIKSGFIVFTCTHLLTPYLSTDHDKSSDFSVLQGLLHVSNA